MRLWRLVEFGLFDWIDSKIFETCSRACSKNFHDNPVTRRVRHLKSQKIKNFDAWAVQCNEFNSRRRCAPEIGGTRKFSVLGSWTTLSWSAWCFAINFMTTFASRTQNLRLGLLRSTCGWTVQAGQMQQSLIDCCVHRCDVSRSTVECQGVMS